jgi:hypothetical protein
MQYVNTDPGLVIDKSSYYNLMIIHKGGAPYLNYVNLKKCLHFINRAPHPNY